MPKKEIPKERREWAKRLYESGKSQSATAREVGVATSTIRNWREADGWVQGAAVDTAEAVIESFAPEQTIPAEDVLPDEALRMVVGEDRVAQLERALTEEQARAAQLERLADAASTVKTVDVYDNVHEVEDFFGPEKIKDMIETELGATNVIRARRGLTPYDLQNLDPKMWEETKARILQDYLDRRTKWVDWSEAKLRVVKMWNPVGFMAQIPVEDHFNNEKGVRGNALMHYKNKGFKLLQPYFCQMNNCWAYAAQENGNLTLHGYCTPEHLAIMEPALAGPAARRGPLATSEAVGY